MRILVIIVPEHGSLAHRAVASAWDIENRLKATFPRIAFEFYQSKDEPEIVEALRRGMDVGTGGVVLSGTVWASPSPAILDAVVALSVPIIAVREENSPGDPEIAAACTGYITGLGLRGYELAMEYLLKAKEQ